MPKMHPDALADAKEALLVEAAKSFARRGFETPLDSVNRRHPASLYYHHFGTKPQVLREIYALFWGRVLDRAYAGLDEAVDPVDRIKAMIDAVIDTAVERDALFRVVTTTSYPRKPRSRYCCEEKSEFQLLALSELQDAKRRGRFRSRSISSKIMYATLSGAVEQILSMYYEGCHGRTSLGLKKRDVHAAVRLWLRDHFVSHQEHESV